MRRTLLLDLDNTLVDTSPLYFRAERSWAWLMKEQGFDGDEALRRYRLYDWPRRVTDISPRRVPNSMMAMYRTLCHEAHLPYSSGVLAECQLIGEAIFSSRAPMYTGVLETLVALERDYDLVVYTMGDPIIQRKRLTDAGLMAGGPLYVVPCKDAGSLHDLLSYTLGLDPDDAISVGDSIAVDIQPAIDNDLHAAIWVHSNDWQGGTLPPSTHATRVRRCKHFHNLPSALENLDD